jgi:hypothetical protein
MDKEIHRQKTDGLMSMVKPTASPVVVKTEYEFSGASFQIPLLHDHSSEESR